MPRREAAANGLPRGTSSGRGVTVYVFDGGIFSDHPELAGRVRRGFDAFPETRHTCNAHGTAVAGAIAGKTLGVAPAAHIVDVKTIDCARQRGTIAAIVEATDWVIRDHQRYPNHPAVVNWSFIVDTSSGVPEINVAVTRLHTAGMLVVVSAGNLDINACDVSPANAPGTLVVGASSTVGDSATSSWRDVRATGTAWGPCVDVYAPGEAVLLPSFDERQVATTALWNGTSMSAGYASGAAALILERMPRATPDQVMALIKAAATATVVDDGAKGSPLTPTRLLFVGGRGH